MNEQNLQDQSTNNAPCNEQSTQNKAQEQASGPNPYNGSCNAMYYTPPKKEKRVYSAYESVGALACYILGFVICRSFPFGVYPLGSFVVSVLALVLITVHIKIKKSEGVHTLTYMFALYSVAFAASLLFCSNILVLFLCCCSFAVCTLMFLYFYRKNGTGGPSAEFFAYDAVKAFIGAPLMYGANAVAAMLYPIRNGKYKKAGSFLKYGLLGIVIAVVPTAFVLANLSFENKFTDLLSDIFSFDGLGTVLEYIFTSLFAIPLALYTFSAASQYIYCGQENKSAATLEANKKANEAKRILPSVTVITASLPLLFLYVVFFISQFEEYTAAFSGTLPDGFIYSNYARSGFFELCKVASVNALFIFCSHILVKCKNGKISVPVKISTLLLSISSLVLIATAMAKMLMYIDAYGMTQKRVYVSLFMVLMALGFVFAVIKQFVPKLKMTWICILLAALLPLICAFSNTDALIASYNVSRYMDGTLECVDYDAFDNYRTAALPALAKLYESEYAANEDKEEIERIARMVSASHEDDSVFSYSIPKYRAQRAIDRILGGTQ